MAAVEQAIWPLMGLHVVTPMLTLRYITDDLGVELALLAAEGVHDPATMPFSTPWTDVPSPELERNTLRFYWRNRADTTAGHWDLNLAVVVDGVAVGMCSIEADAFPTRRSAETGSWVGRRYQRRGIGREVRHAALHLIFAGFDADQATTRAWHDNTASLGVTRSLPYVQTGSSLQQRRERPDTMLEFTMSRAQWNTARREDIDLIGIDAARAQLKNARDVPSSDG
jgi:RimJ/RimL family protein N-acetyltransferase